MLKSIPSFWGAQEIKYVVDLYLDEELVLTKGLSSQLDKLTKLMAKQLSGKTVTSSLLQCWPPIEGLSRPVSPSPPFFVDENLNFFQSGVARFARFFDLLKRCLHYATRADILENLRSIFTNFLHAFDARSVLPSSEASAVRSSFDYFLATIFSL